MVKHSPFPTERQSNAAQLEIVKKEMVYRGLVDDKTCHWNMEKGKLAAERENHQRKVSSDAQAEQEARAKRAASY